jgi:hypothetical protein
MLCIPRAVACTRSSTGTYVGSYCTSEYIDYMSYTDGTAVLDLDLASTVDTAVQLYSSRRYYSRMIDLLISMQTYTLHI